jgi:hypothetical protein
MLHEEAGYTTASDLSHGHDSVSLIAGRSPYTPVRPRVTASLEAGFRDQREEPFAPPRCDAEIPGDARADTQTNPRPTQIRSGCPRGDRVA